MPATLRAHIWCTFCMTTWQAQAQAQAHRSDLKRLVLKLLVSSPCYVKLDVAKRSKLRSYVAFTCSVASGKRSNILPTAGCFCNNVVLAGSRLKKSKMRVQTPVHE